MLKIDNCNIILLQEDEYVYLKPMKNISQARKAIQKHSPLQRISLRYTAESASSGLVSEFLEMFTEIVKGYVDFSFNSENLESRIASILQVLGASTIDHLSIVSDKEGTMLFITTEKDVCFSVWFEEGKVSYRFRNKVESFVDKLSLEVFDSESPDYIYDSNFYAWEV